jgi:hypothetical protein
MGNFKNKAKNDYYHHLKKIATNQSSMDLPPINNTFLSP